MLRLIIRLIVVSLALFLGIFAERVWESRRAVVNALVEFAKDYQD